MMRHRLLFLLPVLAFLALAIWFWLGLAPGRDPSLVPTVMIDKEVPGFDLPPLIAGKPGLKSADLKGRLTLINFFASWCIPCVQEAPVLMTLKQQGTPIWGIAYKDKTEAATDFLHRNGDPYTRIACDAPGTTAINFGLYGVPETYVVDRAGIVRWRWAGGLSDDVVRQSLAPLLQSLA